MKKKIEGYWWSKANPEYPMPIPNQLTEQEAFGIWKLITAKQRTARKLGYKGLSTSRITGEKLGSHEYVTNEWTWPGDFADHYVLSHKVKPSDDFLNYIGYEKSTNTPIPVGRRSIECSW